MSKMKTRNKITLRWTINNNKRTAKYQITHTIQEKESQNDDGKDKAEEGYQKRGETAIAW